KEATTACPRKATEQHLDLRHEKLSLVWPCESSASHAGRASRGEAFSRGAESVQPGWVLDQNTATHFRVGRPHGEQVQQLGILRNGSPHGGMWPIAAPDHARGISFDQRARKGHDIMVGIR